MSSSGASSSKTTHIGKKDNLTYALKAKKAKEKELELKRERGEISCAECKRLKLKCNKKVPCSSCVRRGCHTICPNGSLASGHGTRFVLANTDKLHNKLLDMSKRIRQLEDALHIAHSSIAPGSYPHPLLTDELLSIKSGVDLPEAEDAQDEVPDLTVSMGTLAISHYGRSLFVGNVGSEALLMDKCGHATNSKVPDEVLTEALSSLPEEFRHLAEGFPFSSTSRSKNEMRKIIKEHLPTYQRATSLVEAYLGNLAWFCRPVQRSQIMEELLPALYKKEWVDEAEDGKEGAEEFPEMHQLALSMALFSCGAVVDLTLPPYNAEAVLFNHLARAALSLKSVFEGTSFETVQTIVLLSKFEFFISKKSSLESAWKLMSFGLILAASIGLHRDPARWNLDEETIRRRRNLFWEIFPIDKFKSMGSGRPCIFHLDEMDCRPPEESEIEYEEGGDKVTFRTWKYRFAKEVLAPTSEYMGKVRPVKYSEILELDRKIREFPDYYYPSNPENECEFNPRVLMWRNWKEILLLFLHRNFFAKAMIDQPVNPLRSNFAPSFLAAYSTSISYLKNARNAYAYKPQLIDRQWTFWAHALVAAVMIGSVACRTAPSLASLTAAAREELAVSIEVFQKVADHPVMAAGLPIVLRLRNKALLLKEQQDLGYPKPVDLRIEDDEAYNELVILKGTARTLDHSNPTSSDLKAKPSKDTSPEPAGSSSKSAGSPATSGPETPGSFSSQVPINSPSIFTNAAPLDQAPKRSWPPQQASNGEINDWELWIQSKMSWLADSATRPEENVQSIPNSGYSRIDKSVSINNSMNVMPPMNVEADNGSQPMPQPEPQAQPNFQPETQTQSLPHLQALSNDSWSELGLRAVLDSLNYDTSQWQAPQSGQFYTNPLVQGPGQMPFSGLDTANTAPNPGDIDFSNAALISDLAASYDFSNFMPNPNMAGMPQNTNMGTGDGQPYMGGNAVLDETLMDTSDASLRDAWRSMTDFPDFMGLDTAGLM